MKRVLQAAVLYFLIVFAVGFVLGVLRVLIIVPAWGERNAELAELPVMLVVIVITAYGISCRWFRGLSRNQLLLSGMIALLFMLVPEFGLVLPLQGISLAEYFQNRDPIAFSGYVFSLMLFSIMPSMIRVLKTRL